MGSLRQLSISQTELVTLAEAKRQCYIHPDDTDAELEAILNALIPVARISVENYIWRQLLEAQYEYRLDAFPETIEVPKPPCVSVDSIQYVNGSGQTVTMSADDYRVSLYSEPARIQPVTSWPEIKDQVDAVIVTFTAGYNGSETPTLPADIKHALLMLIKYLYDNRDAVAVNDKGSIAAMELPWSARQLLDAYSVRSFI